MHVSGVFEHVFAAASPAIAHCGKLLCFSGGVGGRVGGWYFPVGPTTYMLLTNFVLPAHMALRPACSKWESSAKHGRSGSGASSRMVEVREIADSCDSLLRRWGMLAAVYGRGHGALMGHAASGA